MLFLTVVGLPSSPVFNMSRALHVASNMAKASAPSTKNFEVGHVCESLPMALEAHFPEIDSLLQLFLNCCVGAVSAYAKQEFSAVPDTDDPDDAQLGGKHSKRTHLGANCFEHVYVMFCVFYFRHFPDSPRKRRMVELDLWKALGPLGRSLIEQTFAVNVGDDLSLRVSSNDTESDIVGRPTAQPHRIWSPDLFPPCLPHHYPSEVQTALEPLVPFAIVGVSDVAEHGERSTTGQL